MPVSSCPVRTAIYPIYPVPALLYQCNSTSASVIVSGPHRNLSDLSSTCGLTASANLQEPGCQGFDLIKPTTIYPDFDLFKLNSRNEEEKTVQGRMLYKKEKFCHIWYLTRYGICQNPSETNKKVGEKGTTTSDISWKMGLKNNWVAPIHLSFNTPLSIYLWNERRTSAANQECNLE